MWTILSTWSWILHLKVGWLVKLLRNTFQPLNWSFESLVPQCFSLYFSLFFSLTFSFLNDTSIFSHFSNPGQSKNYVSCIPRIPFKLQFVEKWHFLTFALQFVWPFSFLERCGTNIFMSQFLWHHGFFERSRVVAGRGASEEVSAVGFCLGSGLFGSCNSD